MSTKVIIAVDIGGKSIKSGFVTATGLLKVLEPCVLPFHPDPDLFFSSLHKQIDNLIRIAQEMGLDVEAVGVGIPGYVDSSTGIAYEAVNLQWPMTNFKQLIEQWSGLPTFIEHDVRCGAIAERQFGELQGEEDFLYVAIGTGLGSAICIRGCIYPGAHGFGGELGHTIVFPGGRKCECGKQGCLEAYSSAKQIELRYKELTGKLLSCREIVELSQKGEPFSRSVWGEAIHALAIALVNYHMILEPHKIVIGGGVASAGEDSLLKPTIERMRTIAPGVRLPRMALSALKHHSGLIGAGYQAYVRLHGLEAHT